jgi:hypothetical protein
MHYARRRYHQVFYRSRLQAAGNRSTVESNPSSLKGSVDTLNRLRSLIIVSRVTLKNQVHIRVDFSINLLFGILNPLTESFQNDQQFH